MICWTPILDYTQRAAGGTRYACILAEALDIPIFNLGDPDLFPVFQEAAGGANFARILRDAAERKRLQRR